MWYAKAVSKKEGYRGENRAAD